MPPRIAPPLHTHLVVEGVGACPLDGEDTIVGRARDNRVVTDHPLVARRHTLLRWQTAGLWVYDLGSANGTFVNGRRVDRAPLHVGDVVRVSAIRVWFLHTLAAREVPPDEASLRAAVLAAPADDAPREVYADWLLERGDPRGELIRYQLTGRDDLAAPLIEAHDLAWAAPLAVPCERWTFRRGFLAEATVHIVAGARIALGEHHPIERVSPLELA